MLGIGNGGVRAKFRRLESGMEEFETVLCFKSEMKEFESSSDAWDQEWKRSSKVGGLELGMDEF